MHPFSWQVSRQMEFLPNGQSGALDGDAEPEDGSSEWKQFDNKNFDLFGVFDFGLQTIGNSLHAPQNVTIYAKTDIVVPETAEYLLKIQSDDQMTLWIDGKETYRHDNCAPVTRSVKRLPLRIERGEHRLRIRVNNGQYTSFADGRWQASIRFRTKGDLLSNVTGK